jgi:hypothetical protein
MPRHGTRSAATATEDPPSITEAEFSKLPVAALQTLAKDWGLNAPYPRKANLLPIVKALRIARLGPFPEAGAEGEEEEEATASAEKSQSPTNVPAETAWQKQMAKQMEALQAAVMNAAGGAGPQAEQAAAFDRESALRRRLLSGSESFPLKVSFADDDEEEEDDVADPLAAMAQQAAAKRAGEQRPEPPLSALSGVPRVALSAATHAHEVEMLSRMDVAKATQEVTLAQQARFSSMREVLNNDPVKLRMARRVFTVETLAKVAIATAENQSADDAASTAMLALQEIAKSAGVSLRVMAAAEIHGEQAANLMEDDLGATGGLKDLVDGFDSRKYGSKKRSAGGAGGGGASSSATTADTDATDTTSTTRKKKKLDAKGNLVNKDGKLIHPGGAVLKCNYCQENHWRMHCPKEKAAKAARAAASS